jgi:hypothetical protein
MTQRFELKQTDSEHEAEIIVTDDHFFLRLFYAPTGVCYHSETRHTSALLETMQALFEADYRSK